MKDWQPETLRQEQDSWFSGGFGSWLWKMWLSDVCKLVRSAPQCKNDEARQGGL